MRKFCLHHWVSYMSFPDKVKTPIVNHPDKEYVKYGTRQIDICEKCGKKRNQFFLLNEYVEQIGS